FGDAIRLAGQALELLTRHGIEYPNRIGAVGQGSKFDSDETYRPPVPMLLEKPPQRRQEHRIEMSRFGQRMGTGYRLKSGVANSERDRAGIEASVAQALGALLAQ